MVSLSLIRSYLSAGKTEAVVEFVTSLGKTALAAGITYALASLTSYHVPDGNKYAAELIAGVGLIRACLTSVYLWATTPAPEQPVSQTLDTAQG